MLVVDIHTHVYPAAYLDMLRARTTVPYIHDPPSGAAPRLIILASDDDEAVPLDQRGRPIDSSYSDIEVKLAFMRQHGIHCSVISLANPWLDFVAPADAPLWAHRVNDDLEAICARHDNSGGGAGGSSKELLLPPPLFAFGALPLSAVDDSASAVVREIERLTTLPHLRGVVLGTTGLGSGLDDRRLDAVWRTLEQTQTLVFVHPHYGLPDAAFGGEPDATSRYGHVLPLALGFPLETTIAIARMLLAGVFDRFPRLRVLLAHCGGTLPFLAGRIESCILHERTFVDGSSGGGSALGPQRSIWDVLASNIYLDAVVYGTPGLKAAVEAAGGADRLLFGEQPDSLSSSVLQKGQAETVAGTDHPFFPPLHDKDDGWPSVTMNYQAIHDSFPQDKDAVAAVLGGNAQRLLNLTGLRS